MSCSEAIVLTLIVALFLRYGGFISVFALFILLFIGIIITVLKLIKKKPINKFLKHSLIYFLIFIIGIIVNSLIPYDEISVNEEYTISNQIKYIYSTDQNDRKFLKTYIFPKAQKIVIERDSARLEIAKTTYMNYTKNNITLTAQDMFNLAMIFQHGKSTEDYEIAYELAKEVVKTGNNIQNAEWLEKATYDRLQLSKGKPQKYGTQKQL